MQPANDEPKDPNDHGETVADNLGATQDFSVSDDLGQTTDIKPPNDLLVTAMADSSSKLEWEIAARSAKARPEPRSVKHLPGFKIEKELGRGAFGVVYAALDEMLERRVAIKVPLINDLRLRQQYIDEARKAVKLDHPSIVPIYQVGKTESGEPFVVQKLIEGKTLRQVLHENDGRLPVDRVVPMLLQACMAVDAAHSSGIVHRDLKPENLLVEPNGRLYVADFGLAIVDDDDLQSKQNELAGTPLYMSPEQFSGRTAWLDGRSDIWALGIILYELLSGKPPFVGRSIAELEEEIKHKDPRPIHQRDPSIPSELDAIFRKCCAKLVGDRFASVREMVAELEKVARGFPTSESAAWSSHTGGGSFSSSLGPLDSGARRADSFSSSEVALDRKASSSPVLDTSNANAPPSLSRWLWVALPILAVAIATGGALLFGFQTRRVEIAKEDGGNNAVQRPSDNVANEANLMLSTPVDSAVSPSGSTITNEDSRPATMIEKAPPSKPFRVSLKEDGTHESIAKAIADSSPGETIRVAPGIYRESVKVDRAIIIQGEPGARLMSTEGTCLDIQASSDSRVEVDGLIIDCQMPKRNSIDIGSGQFIIRNSDVFATLQQSYDCIKVHENATLAAMNCKFQSAEHAAIRGEPNSIIAIRNCSFSFTSQFEEGSKRCGVQARNAQAEIKNCSFQGPCLAGIEWFDTPDRPLTIESCIFLECHTAISTQNCHNVVVSGSKEKPTEIRMGVFGVNAVNSKAKINWLDAEATGDKNRVALQATEQSVMKVENANLRGYMCGSLIKDSELSFESLKVSKTRFAGILVDDSKLDGTTLEMTETSNFGLVILSTSAMVTLESLSVEAVDDKDGRTVSGIYATSGEISFSDARFSNCLCGFFLDPSRMIIEDVGMPKRSTLADLLKTSKKPDSPLPITGGDRMFLTNCEYSWIFNGTGTVKVEQLDGNIPQNRQSPTLLPQGGKLGDELEMEKLGDFHFVVRRKPR
jgi:serine/threonine protein kinase